MIVPSVDIRGGRAVQLVGGKEQALDAGDPRDMAEKLGVAGELAVIDLDAALGTGDNRALIREIVARRPCRVGGGIRSYDDAVDWLDAGARRVILGTAAEPGLLSRLPRDRVIAALDAVDGEIVVRGWTERTGRRVEERLVELREHVGGFLVTFVEREGRLAGADAAAAAALRAIAGDAKLTVAGGVREPAEVAALDRIGCDAQVGMALYTREHFLADTLAAMLRSDREDGLWPTVVCDAAGTALGLAYSDRDSLRRAVASRRGVYRSRKRGVWEKGATSGNVQELLRIDLDCDRDTLRFLVRQQGPGFCHRDTWSCWGDGAGLGALERRLHRRLEAGAPGSYTRELAAEPDRLAAKIREEADELIAAASPAEVVWEAADLMYFTLVRLCAAGVGLDRVERELDRRADRIRRGRPKEDGS
jgi:phosphoribosyl-ATP pyrophosphohydrolase